MQCIRASTFGWVFFSTFILITHFKTFSLYLQLKLNAEAAKMIDCDTGFRSRVNFFPLSMGPSTLIIVLVHCSESKSTRTISKARTAKLAAEKYFSYSIFTMGCQCSVLICSCHPIFCYWIFFVPNWRGQGLDYIDSIQCRFQWTYWHTLLCFFYSNDRCSIVRLRCLFGQRSLQK